MIHTRYFRQTASAAIVLLILHAVNYSGAQVSPPRRTRTAGGISEPKVPKVQLVPGKEYYIPQKTAPAFDNKGRQVGDLFGGVAVRLRQTYDASKGVQSQSGLLPVELWGWVLKEKLKDEAIGGSTELNSDTSLWSASQMATHREQPSFRLGILETDTNVTVLELDENYARVFVPLFLERGNLVSRISPIKGPQGTLRDTLTNGSLSVWLTDVMRTYDHNPVSGSMSTPVKIGIQITNQSGHSVQVWAIRCRMYGKDTGYIAMTTVHAGDQLRPFILAQGETKTFNFNHDSYPLLPYANRAIITVFQQPIKAENNRTVEDLYNTFYFTWKEEDIRGDDF